MPKAKVKRTKPSIDMTPMVDLAFLLVTFFMLTATPTPDEAVIVDTPSSVSEIKLRDADVITITVSNDNRVFFGVDGKHTKETLLDRMAQKYGVTFNEEQRQTFALIPSFGVPINQLGSFLSVPGPERKDVNQPGIPIDSVNNQLSDWVWETRKLNPSVIIAIKGDVDVSYETVDKVISTLEARKVNTFNLITDMETRPTIN
ncbi:ExbD/TolR family protein [Pontibacter harenae]|uniref:ExbD/TolR family protein n=1 Tax=Pontibacter harenae TaxID=2894083 RepID=UPI001E61BD82|nr:biopolymer transporter ExbD [Pontibacter harenae]MCC9169118.1 biopolymer transporter ExbD [Pontibacter harenae]